MSIVNDALDVVGVKSLFDGVKQYYEIRQGFDAANSANTINELNASTSLLRLQNQARQADAGDLNPNAKPDYTKYLGWGVVVVLGAGALWLLAKK